eukprot:snap_masked-scaffold_76-processed-gene-0.45-mRNA-1 protein AED:1.00 eAED:1.00 QI:0/0/0/0/1/1/2/0/127
MKWVATSSGVSEFLALHLSVKEVLHIFYLIVEGFRTVIEVPYIFCDSKAARDISKAEAPANSTCYLGTNYFMIQQLVEEKLIKIEEIGTHDNLADLFKKSLEKMKFNKFRDQILYSSLNINIVTSRI